LLLQGLQQVPDIFFFITGSNDYRDFGGWLTDARRINGNFFPAEIIIQNQDGVNRKQQYGNQQ
jgi:hypothetical protein